ncbi:MAG TPA: biotin/lipoyl-containing protein [Bryobacteraceae bacterium]
MTRPTIRINGVPIEPASVADILEVEPGVYSVILDGSSYEFAITGGEIEINGARLQVERQDPRKWNSASAARRAEGRESIKAPMPGKVVRLLVAEGDDVEAGQGVVVVEAMKMQNEMKSPCAGKVISIAVKEHQAITAGSVLLTIE